MPTPLLKNQRNSASSWEALSPVGLSDDESSIDRERIYTKGARALGAAMIQRGPAGSPDFWENVKVLLDIANATFIPRFVANRVPQSDEPAGPVHYAYRQALTWLRAVDRPDNRPFDAGQNFRNILAEISDPGHKSNDIYLRFLERLRDSHTGSTQEERETLTAALIRDLTHLKD